VGIERIYASTNGRAMETAAHTAELLGLPILPCDFMREIAWRSLTDEPIPKKGHPWELADLFAAEGRDLTDKEWRTQYPFCQSVVVERVDKVVAGFDALLAELGYLREGSYYRVTKENEHKVVAMFSHGGSSSAVLSHMLNIPFPQFCGMIHPDFTSVIVIKLPERVGETVQPMLCSLDAAHIKGLDAEKVFGN
jgi:probable phosphoglycerate mutase